MTGRLPQRIRTISEFHRFRDLPGPEHPLISVIDYSSVKHTADNNSLSWVQDYYSISLKRTSNAKMRYGQQQYDFDNGVLFFMAPGQVFSIEIDPASPPTHTGWMLLVHPDFLWNSALATSIKKYEYFGYAVNEALFLSEKEEASITAIIQNIEQEYRSPIDRFSQDVIIAQLELLLTYADRYYHRQFVTRKISSHRIVERLEECLDEWFTDGAQGRDGLPTVQYVADTLHVSPNYLGSLLKTLTGRSTQQHIQDKLIETAKERLSATELSVGEIAYGLGFGHTQSFSKLFRLKTRLSPSEFRERVRG